MVRLLEALGAEAWGNSDSTELSGSELLRELAEPAAAEAEAAEWPAAAWTTATPRCLTRSIFLFLTMCLTWQNVNEQDIEGGSGPCSAPTCMEVRTPELLTDLGFDFDRSVCLLHFVHQGRHQVHELGLLCQPGSLGHQVADSQPSQPTASQTGERDLEFSPSTVIKYNVLPPYVRQGRLGDEPILDGALLGIRRLVQVAMGPNQGWQ